MIIKKKLIITSALIAINLISVVSADTGLKWESKNKNIKGQIFGRISIQSGFTDIDDNTNTITTNSDYLYYRRIRLGALGQIGPVSFKIEPDFAPYMETVLDGNIDFKDVWVGYQFKMNGIKHKFIVGNDQTPCGLEVQNSSSFMNHIERHGTLSSWCQGERTKGYLVEKVGQHI